MSKRTIRLKEHGPNLTTYTDAPERTRDLSDESLPDGPYVLRTDSQGFISTGNEINEDADDLFMVGGSFVESHFAAEELRFASQVERLLSAAGTPYRVRNAGYSGMTSLHMLGVLSVKIPPLLKPGSKVLLVIGQSDVNALSSPGLYWEQSRTLTPFGAPTGASYVFADRWQDAFVRMVTTIVTFAQLHQFDLAMTAGVFRNGDFARDAVVRRTYRRNREAYDASIEKRLFVTRTVREIAEQNAVPVFDPSTEFLARPEYFYDLMHLNHEGQAQYSKALASWISEHWLRSGAEVH